ncbi:hypothetical protein ASF56_24760 [Methylobacterium sp. Leaf122]|nr:hypothetical protein ASF56_24760 [Methylobacterium sp. Leaf122]
MFKDEIRRAAEAAARIELPAVSAALWKALAAGNVTETEAEELSELIEARKAVPVALRPAPARRGSRPRTDASMERRRRWAASGRLPPALAWKFTTAELAVLSLVAAEVAKHGRCTLAHGHLAAVAGVSVSSVKRAMTAAREAGLIEVEVRRVSAFRNDTNIVTITSREWLSWLRLARQGGGVQVGTDTHTQVLNLGKSSTTEPSRGLPNGSGRPLSGTTSRIVDGR